MSRKKIHQYREAWLTEALWSFLAHHFKREGYIIPKKTRVTTGWPSNGALGRKSWVMGQCWYPETSEDGHAEIIISLRLDDPYEVLSTLAHEAVHAAMGAGYGHGREFKAAGTAIGLVGKPTRMEAGEDLRRVFRTWLKDLGKWPGAKVNGTKKRGTKGSRLIGLTCPACSCKVRVTAKWLEEYGVFTCPCGTDFEENQ